jgi:hypothetical protein
MSIGLMLGLVSVQESVTVRAMDGNILYQNPNSVRMPIFVGFIQTANELSAFLDTIQCCHAIVCLAMMIG